MVAFVSLLQEAGDFVVTPTFLLSIGIPTLVVLALETLLRREFRKEFPSTGDFKNLENKVDAIDKTRSADSRELRALIGELRGLIEVMREANVRLSTEFAVFKERMENRLSVVEKEEERLSNRRGA